MKISILTDSTCDLSSDFIQRRGITVLPLTVNLEGRAYLDDGVDITPDDIFRAVDAGADLPKTAAVNVAGYRDAFEAALKDCDAVIHFAIGTEFSSCHANAVLAAENLPVYCVDTRNLSCGMGLLVAEASDLLADGWDDPAALADHCRAAADRVDCSFILDRLDYLHKGGRCSMAALMGANLLRLKPCIEVSNGAMAVGRKYRGSYERCLNQYAEDRLRNPAAIDPRRVFLAHTGLDADRLKALRRTVEGILPFEEIVELRVGSTITSHCGQNTCGLMFMRK